MRICKESHFKILLFYTGSTIIFKGDFMNNRKQHVLKKAHQLFIEKGFQSTSIQDILDYSGISKGTFYNYFSSKNELLIAIFKSNYAELEKQKNELLIGQDRSDIEIFIQQIHIQMKLNRENKLISLFEEVMTSNDAELKQFIEIGKMRNIRWLYQRLIDIFGESKKPYLLDCAIMFMGILRENLKFYHLAYESNVNISRVIRYSVKRLEKMVEGVVEIGDQLIRPELLDSWLSDGNHCAKSFEKNLNKTVITLKNTLHNETECIELLNFVQEEMLHMKNPRKYLLESVVQTLKAKVDKDEVLILEELIENYFSVKK